MKKIEAIIRPQMLENVKNALTEMGISGLTITEVRGFGKQKGFIDRFRISEVYVNLLPKMEVKVIVKDAEVNTVVQTIIESAQTGEIGDGKVFVSPVEEAYRIRTGEKGDEVI